MKNRLPLATKNTPKSNEAVNKIMDGFADIHRYTKWSFEPSDAKEGTVIYADGDAWNPGKGAGIYKKKADDSWEYMGVSFGEDNILRHDTDQTVTAQHTFNPDSEGAPFSLGSNAQGQLVSGLNSEQLDGYDASSFLLLAGSQTITGQPSFSPATARAPFVLGANARYQLVTGLNADRLQGYEPSGFALVGHNHDGVYLPVGGSINADTLDGQDSTAFARKALYNEFTYSSNQFKSIKIAGWNTATMSNFIELTGADSGYSTTWFLYQYKPDSSFADNAFYLKYNDSDKFAVFPSGDIWAGRYVQAQTGFYCGSSAGVTASFYNYNGVLITVKGGIITGVIGS